LNFFRHVIALHHDNATIRNGAEFVLDRDAANTLVWMRRPAAGTRTAPSVVVAVNLSAVGVTLDLAQDLAAQGMRGGTLRPLLTATTSAGNSALFSESVGQMVLPPLTLFVGELNGAAASSRSRR
jgi:hypothetical protein